MVEGEEEERVVTSAEKERLPRIPPPRRRKMSEYARAPSQLHVHARRPKLASTE